MNLSLNKGNWCFELTIIIIAILAINLSVVFIGFNSPGSIITGQTINFMGFCSLLILSIFRIRKNSNQLLKYFKNKPFITDLLLVAILIVIGKISYNILIDNEFIKHLNLDIFRNRQHNERYLAGSVSTIIISLSMVMLFLGVIAEELYFRLYLFEIQYCRFKNYTWIVNGLSWSMYHVFSSTNFLALLPTCLIYSYIYQKRRNIWITIFAHLINNFIAFYPVLKTYLR